MSNPEINIPSDRPMHRCPECNSGFVQPIDWDMVDRSDWRVTLLCPNCELVTTDIYSQKQVTELDKELERGMRKLQITASKVTRTIMEAETELFVQALEANAITPFDF